MSCGACISKIRQSTIHLTSALVHNVVPRACFSTWQGWHTYVASLEICIRSDKAEKLEFAARFLTATCRFLVAPVCTRNLDSSSSSVLSPVNNKSYLCNVLLLLPLSRPHGCAPHHSKDATFRCQPCLRPEVNVWWAVFRPEMSFSRPRSWSILFSTAVCLFFDLYLFFGPAMRPRKRAQSFFNPYALF